MKAYKLTIPGSDRNSIRYKTQVSKHSASLIIHRPSSADTDYKAMTDVELRARSVS